MPVLHKSLHKSGLAAVLLMCAASAAFGDGIGPFTAGVPNANEADGRPATVFSPDFDAKVIVQGADELENPAGHLVTFGDLRNGESTDPDQNLYLVTGKSLHGPEKKFDYGRHYLFQGHENGRSNAFVTRINLDVTDAAHRITLLTPPDDFNLTHFNWIDGSAFDPFTRSLFFTQEGTPSAGGVVEVSLGWPAKVTTRYGIMGRCAYEGIHVDDKGRVYLVEDSEGKAVSIDENDIDNPQKFANQPGAFIYRFVPYDRKSIDAGGKLQALQVIVDGEPLVYGGSTEKKAFADTWSPKQLALHSGQSFPTRWLTIHDTAAGTGDFSCHAAARDAGATPFKRSENAVFQPDGTFRNFFFATTGDTDSRSGSVPGLAARGAWGGIFHLTLDAGQENGQVALFALGDATHNSFDNITFGDSATLLVAEDRGDTLHKQLNAFDSAWAYPLADPAAPLRIVALGRDVARDDNEVTGLFVSAGQTSRDEQYGTPANMVGARGFFTAQHGDNKIYELIHK